MGKRSDKPKRPKDKYYTWDARAYDQVSRIFEQIGTFVEPCAGGGDMIYHLERLGLRCLHAGDIEPTKPDNPRAAAVSVPIDAMAYWELPPDSALADADCIITNPPWTRSALHPFIDWCVQSGKPAWLLIDSNWAMTRQARMMLRYCSHIVPNPRLKWIVDTTDSAMDDTAWFRFQAEPCETILKNEFSPFIPGLPEYSHRDERPFLHELI